MPVKNTNEQILVVDDDQAIRWTLREALQSWGFAAVEAGTVAEAVKQFKTDPPAAVLLDIDLPDGSGLDLMRQLRLRQPVRGIALSGFGMDEDVKRSRDAGFDEHLTKPVSLDVLETTIQRVVEG